jgi:hypothetical protein
MNETDFAVSRVADRYRPRLLIIPAHRQFAIRTLVSAVILLSTLTGICEIENIPPSIKVPLSVLKPQPALPVVKVAVLSEAPPPLQLQPVPRVRTVDNDEWDYNGKDFIKNRPDRWEKFEAEFGIAEPEQSLALRSLQMAKYTVDKVTFAANEFTRNLSSATQFEFNNGRISRVPATRQWRRDDPSCPSMCIPERISVGLDVNIILGKPYVGIAFVMPIGK